MPVFALPVTPTAKLTTFDTAGETLIYDAATKQYHALNATSSAIWTAAGTESSIPDIANTATGLLNFTVTPEMVNEALEHFAGARLIVTGTPPAAVTRRSVIRAAAAMGTLALAASPAITSVGAGDGSRNAY